MLVDATQYRSFAISYLFLFAATPKNSLERSQHKTFHTICSMYTRQNENTREFVALRRATVAETFRVREMKRMNALFATARHRETRTRREERTVTRRGKMNREWNKTPHYVHSTVTERMTANKIGFGRRPHQSRPVKTCSCSIRLMYSHFPVVDNHYRSINISF